ncbi:polysaccharide pyruvyl transferase family protein [Belliella sp. R4-6]|uniref:Polysaccharide pyruvyl transferase family protein n=1 Tax=Belliella alkalica TaxID=1730871 RepID=A0ABS9VDW1_9BACT|nr:polysaccharide pyruvyl transferase family protein [Belliella alkalica]MCH7414629.1 polysaccharide pyruvyl transferase family protein [Belliella alkalica]
MKIAILNAEAGGNKGAEAMLEVLIKKLTQRFSGIELFLEVSSKIEYYNDVFLPRLSNDKIKVMRFKPKSLLNPFDLDVSEMDFAIDIGGINFHDGSFRSTLRNLVRYLPFVKKKGKLIFFTQDFGPAKKGYNIFLAKIILSRSLGIFTRSQFSYNEVLRNFKVSPEKVFGPFPDSTLVYHPEESAKLPFELDENYVVFSPSAIMYSKFGKEYLEYFYKLYLQLSNRFKILILVHNFTLNENNSDNEVCLSIKDYCPDAILFNDNVSTATFKYILKNAKFSVSSRYHVVVGSISQNIPSLAIGWNPKYESFLKLYDKTEWNLKFDDQILENTLKSIESIELDKHSEKLELRNFDLKEKVNNSFSKLFKLLE